MGGSGVRCVRRVGFVIGGVLLIGLATAGARIYRTVSQGLALNAAAAEGDVRRMRVLIRGGASPNGLWPSWLFSRPLFAATGSQNAGAVGVLLSSGASPNVLDRDGSTPLIQVVEGAVDIDPERYEAMTRMLLEAGADPHVRDASGFTPVQWADRCGHRRIAGLLRASMARQATRGRQSKSSAGASAWP